MGQIVPIIPDNGPNLNFGYFMGRDDQIPFISGNVSYLMTNDWGNWTTAQEWIINQGMNSLTKAAAAGIPKVIFSIAPLVFTSDYKFKGIFFLQQFKIRLQNSGFYDMVDTFYVLDEPDVGLSKGLTEATLITALQGIRQVFPDKKLMTIYSNSGNYPGLKYFDYVGKDDYSAGVGVLQELPPISGSQMWVIVPGGANPWKEDPNPFYTFAKTHPVKYIVAFLADDFPFQGHTSLGIINNGMLNEYNTVGREVLAGNPKGN